MNKEDKLILGTLAGLDLVLSPEHYEEYKGTLNKQLEEKNKEIDRLNKEYERIYNENCKLRENHNINDITLLDENERLNKIIDNIFKFMQNKYDNSDLTGFTISFMELQDLKALKENNNE